MNKRLVTYSMDRRSEIIVSDFLSPSPPRSPSELYDEEPKAIRKELPQLWYGHNSFLKGVKDMVMYDCGDLIDEARTKIIERLESLGVKY